MGLPWIPAEQQKNNEIINDYFNPKNFSQNVKMVEKNPDKVKSKVDNEKLGKVWEEKIAQNKKKLEERLQEIQGNINYNKDLKYII